MHGTTGTTAAAAASTSTDGIDNSTLRALLGVLPWRQGYELEGIINNRVHCYEVHIYTIDYCIYQYTILYNARLHIPVLLHIVVCTPKLA
jgi:hypothetical protein